MSIERMFLKDRIMQETGLEHYEILLDSDREPDVFDSQNLYQSIHNSLTVEEQKKVQLGMQWLGDFDGFNPVLIGDYAKAHNGNSVKKLPPIAEFVLDGNYEKLIRNVEKESFKKKNVEVKFNDSFIEIPAYGCRVYNRVSKPEFEEMIVKAKYAKLFRYGMQVSG